MFSKRENHCCKNCIKKHISCPIAGDVAEYAVSCTHKMISTETETIMQNKTIEDAVRELDGNWNKAVYSSLIDFDYLRFNDGDGHWWTAHEDSLWVKEGKIVCTKKQFEEAAEKYHKEKVQPYIPQAGDWFLLTHKDTKSFPTQKHFCIGRNTHGNVVYEDSSGKVWTINTENFKFKQSFLSVEEEWKMQAYDLLETASKPKDVIHKIYQALVSGELSIPK